MEIGNFQTQTHQEDFKVSSASGEHQVTSHKNESTTRTPAEDETSGKKKKIGRRRRLPGW